MGTNTGSADRARTSTSFRTGEGAHCRGARYGGGAIVNRPHHAQPEGRATAISIIAAWGERFRTVTTSLLGYGGTAERRTARDTSPPHLRASRTAPARRRYLVRPPQHGRTRRERADLHRQNMADKSEPRALAERAERHIISTHAVFREITKVLPAELLSCQSAPPVKASRFASQGRVAGACSLGS
jgi:hypothetical protein